MKKFYVSTSIPYVNASPHVGFGLELIQADAAARFWRQKLGPENVFFATGTDENSLKNVRAAEDASEKVASFVERHAEEFKRLKSILNTSNNDFIRTRDERHMKGAQKLWNAFQPEDIYKKEYKGLYCVGCETFYTEKDAENGKCPIHKKELEVVEEDNYFFKLSNYQDAIQELLESNKIKIYPETRKNEILSFVRSGLEDFSISRSQQRAKNWGVPVPGDEDQVMYVWVDALSNYITILDYAEDGEKFHEFWDEGSARAHVIGKDIIRFHAVYWPAMLLSAGLPLPTEMYVHGFFTVEGEKMSKSLGNVMHPKQLVDEFGVEAVRYFMLREMPYASDGDLSLARVEDRYAELANQLGNLVGRVAAMSNKYFGGKLEQVDKDWSNQEKSLEETMNVYDFKKYIDTIFEVVSESNEIIDKEAPFKLVKTDPEAAKEVLSRVAENIRFIARSLLPVTPETAQEILNRYEGDVILIGEPLFPRRD